MSWNRANEKLGYVSGPLTQSREHVVVYVYI